LSGRNDAPVVVVGLERTKSCVHEIQDEARRAGTVVAALLDMVCGATLSVHDQRQD
jgi:hypothetical protein